MWKFKELQIYLHNEGLLEEGWTIDVDKIAIRIYEQHKLIDKMALIMLNNGDYDSIPEEAKTHPRFKSLEEED